MILLSHVKKWKSIQSGLQIIDNTLKNRSYDHMNHMWMDDKYLSWWHHNTYQIQKNVVRLCQICTVWSAISLYTTIVTCRSRQKNNKWSPTYSTCILRVYTCKIYQMIWYQYITCEEVKKCAMSPLCVRFDIKMGIWKIITIPYPLGYHLIRIWVCQGHMNG